MYVLQWLSISFLKVCARMCICKKQALLLLAGGSVFLQKLVSYVSLHCLTDQRTTVFRNELFGYFITVYFKKI